MNEDTVPAQAPETTFTLRCQLVAEDYRAFQRHHLFHYRKIHWIYASIFGGMLLLIWFTPLPQSTLKERIFGLIGAAVMFGLISGAIFLIFRLVGKLTRSRFRGPLGDHVFEFSPEGIKETNANGTSETRPAALRSVDETGKYFFVINTGGQGYILPKRDLTDTKALREWQKQINREN